jgi:membrane dipeptidase
MSENPPPALDRRQFLSLAGCLAMTTALPSSTTSPEKAGQTSDGPMIINALGELGNPNLDSDVPTSASPVAGDSDAGVDARALADAQASGLTAVTITLGFVAGPMEPFEYTIKGIGLWDRIVRQHPSQLLKVHTAADIVQARSERRIGVIFGMQNAAQVGENAARVDIFADLGVRVIQLTYNPRNQLGDGSAVAENRGLTALGRDVVARLNARRVMVDLSHSGENTCLEAARLSTQPVSINHTGCRALADLPRNKTDEELRLVASKGGFVGIFFMPFLKADGHPDANDVVAHIEHAINICGEDHVGIGTDGDTTGIDDLGLYSAHLAKEVADRARAGLGATGERADTYPFVVDLRGPDQFRKLMRLLKARGHSETRIEKIMGLNFLAFAKDVWGA